MTPEHTAVRASDQPVVPPGRVPSAAKRARQALESVLVSLLLHLPLLFWASHHLAAPRTAPEPRRLYEVDSLPLEPAPPPPAAPAPVPEPVPEPDASPALDASPEPEALPEPLPPPPPAASPEPPAGTDPSSEPDDPYELAEAGSALVVEDGSDAPFTIVQGKGSRYAGGHSAPDGTSKRSVRQRPKKVGASPRPRPRTTRRRAPPVRAKNPKDLAQRPRPARGNWNCPFPARADAERVHHARVALRARVGLDGRALQVIVTRDPGHGFSAAASACARRERFRPGTRRDGRKTIAWTPTFIVTFRR